MVSRKIENDDIGGQDLVVETPDSFVFDDGTEVAKQGLSADTYSRYKDLVSANPKTQDFYVDINRRSPENSVTLDGRMPDQSSSDFKDSSDSSIDWETVGKALKDAKFDLTSKDTSHGMPAGVYGMSPTGFQPQIANIDNPEININQATPTIAGQPQPGMATQEKTNTTTSPNDLVPQAIQSMPGYASPQQISQGTAGQGGQESPQGSMPAQSSVGSPGSSRVLSVSGSGPSGSGGFNRSGLSLAEQGLREGANAESAQARAAMDIHKATEEALKAQQVQENILKANQERQKAFDEMYTQINKGYEELMNMRVNPNRIFEKATTGDRVLAGIGILLSGIGSGLTGQRNGAIEVINRLIDNDIEAQKQEIDKKKEGMEFQRNLYSLMRERTGDDVAATLVTKNFILEEQGRRIEQLATRFSGPKAQANAKLLIGKIQAEQAQNQQEYLMKMGDRQIRLLEIERKYGDKGPGKAYDPNFGQFISPKAREEFLSLKSNSDLAIRNLDKMIDLVKQNPWERTTNLRTKRELEIYVYNLTNYLRSHYIPNNKKASDKDREFIQEVIGNPTELLSNTINMTQRLERIKKMIVDRIKSELQYKTTESPESYSETKDKDTTDEEEE